MDGRGDIDRTVYVIGMHRSGTSAIAGLLRQMGLHGPASSDLIPASRWNERGNGESATLNRFNNRLLQRLGGSWSAPPKLDPGWERSTPVLPLRDHAASLSRKHLYPKPFVWKDPR